MVENVQSTKAYMHIFYTVAKLVLFSHFDYRYKLAKKSYCDDHKFVAKFKCPEFASRFLNKDVLNSYTSVSNFATNLRTSQ